MKKNILFLALTVTILSFVSCSNDNDNNSPTDPIIGTWHHFSSEGVEVGECRKKSTQTYSRNGKVTSIGLIKDSTSGKCTQDSNISGTWENIGNNNYKYTFNNKSMNAKIIFSNNNNTMTFGTIVYKRK